MDHSTAAAKNADLNVVYALDDNFALLTSVSIESLLANNVDAFEKITIHIFDDGISENNKLNLTGIAKKYNREKSAEIEIQFYRMENISQLESLPKTEQFPLATYFRFFIPTILREDIKICLYLDGDTIICKSLKELVRHDITDYDIGGVLDLGMSLVDPDNRGSRGKYVNAGVLLINLVRWREKNMHEILLKYANENAAALSWLDQDVINSVIPEKSKLLLPPCYNNINTSKYYSAKVRKNSEAFQIYGAAAIRKAKRKPVILHYGGNQFASGDLVYINRAKQLFERYRKKGTYSKLRYFEIVNKGKGLTLNIVFAKRMMACIPIPLRGCIRDIYGYAKQLISRKSK